MAGASTLVLAANQCGVFFSNFFISITTTLHIFEIKIANTYFICLIIYLALAIILTFIGKRLLPRFQHSSKN